MPYPTEIALNAGESQYPDLWTGLVFAYVPGHNADAALVGGDTFSHTGTTSVVAQNATYTEGPVRQYDKSAHSIGQNTHWNGLNEFTQLSFFHLRELPLDVSDNGVFGNATSIAGWSNVSQFTVARYSSSESDNNAPKIILRIGGTERVAVYTDSATTVGTNLWVGGRGADNKLWIKTPGRSRIEASTALSGALSNHAPPIFSSYYDPSSVNRGTSIGLYYGALWSRTLTTAEIELLETDPWAPFRKTVPAVTTVTSGELKNNTGTLLNALTVPKVWLVPLATADYTNLTTNASGELVIEDATLTPGAAYLIVTSDADGTNVGVSKATAS